MFNFICYYENGGNPCQYNEPRQDSRCVESIVVIKAIVTYVSNYCQWNLKVSNELPIFSWLPGFHYNYESFIGGHCLKQADLLLIEITLIIRSESRPRV
jgi:hypothetical protein